jgi:putative membrane protein
VVLVLGAIAVFYWWAFTRLGPRYVGPGVATSTPRQRHWIAAGLAWTFVWSAWPLHDIAERYLLLVHMTQHTVFTLVAPACFLLGTPQWLWEIALSTRATPVLRFLSRPIVALAVFNLLVAGTHWKGIVERSLHNELFHFVVHVVLFSSATLMWVPVIHRSDKLWRLGAPAKMAYLFAQSVVPTVPAAFLVFTRRATYPTYRNAPRLIKSLDAVGDQQLAAAIMKLGAGSLLWSIVGYLFYKWWQDSNANRVSDNRRATDGETRIAGLTLDGKRTGSASPADDVLTWEAVQAEFARIDSEQAAPREEHPLG